ncbi:hypothetical protein [Caballeronia sp. LZ035]|nr:hypothetical protein [Caballeronia sp. LZ035]MDR5763019.1 hypothetical protein [Caballeronia sp. LZ035]
MVYAKKVTKTDTDDKGDEIDHEISFMRADLGTAPDTSDRRRRALD